MTSEIYGLTANGATTLKDMYCQVAVVLSSKVFLATGRVLAL
jgi:hypothetical protein